MQKQVLQKKLGSVTPPLPPVIMTDQAANQTTDRLTTWPTDGQTGSNGELYFQ